MKRLRSPNVGGEWMSSHGEMAWRKKKRWRKGEEKRWPESHNAFYSDLSSLYSYPGRRSYSKKRSRKKVWQEANLYSDVHQWECKPKWAKVKAPIKRWYWRVKEQCKDAQVGDDCLPTSLGGNVLRRAEERHVKPHEDYLVTALEEQVSKWQARCYKLQERLETVKPSMKRFPSSGDGRSWRKECSPVQSSDEMRAAIGASGHKVVTNHVWRKKEIPIQSTGRSTELEADVPQRRKAHPERRPEWMLSHYIFKEDSSVYYTGRRKGPGSRSMSRSGRRHWQGAKSQFAHSVRGARWKESNNGAFHGFGMIGDQPSEEELRGGSSSFEEEEAIEEEPEDPHAYVRMKTRMGRQRVGDWN